MSQISDSEIEDIMIKIQKMNLNETKEVIEVIWGIIEGDNKTEKE